MNRKEVIARYSNKTEYEHKVTINPSQINQQIKTIASKKNERISHNNNPEATSHLRFLKVFSFRFLHILDPYLIHSPKAESVFSTIN